MKKQINIKKLILLNLPYILVGLFATNFGEAWRLAQGGNASERCWGCSLSCPMRWGASGPASTRWICWWASAAELPCGWQSI